LDHNVAGVYAGTLLSDAPADSAAYASSGSVDLGYGLLDAYWRHGVALPESLRGEFAFVVVDFTARHMTVGKGNVGGFPLYIAVEEGNMGVATSELTLAKLGFRKPQAISLNSAVKVRFLLYHNSSCVSH
jgi:asparagine synthetase B (glutamine-hydrolysing)